MTVVDELARQELARCAAAVERLEARFRSVKAELIDVARELREAEARQAELVAYFGEAAEPVAEPPVQVFTGPWPSVTLAPPPPTLGQVLREARLALGVEVQDVARRIGMTVNYLYAVEADRSRPSYRMRLQLAEQLGVDYGRLCALNPPLRGRPVTP